MRVLGSAASAAIFAAVGAPRLLKAQSLRAPTARAMSTAQPKVTQDGERRGLITIAPGDDGTPHTATFIGPIHGLGDTNMGWAQQAMMLHQQLPWVKFVLPNAPTSPVTLNGGMAMPSWYDITDLTDRAGQECAGIDESRAEIIELIEEAKAEINRRHQATREQLNREKAELLEKINLTDGLLNDAESDMKEQILMLALSQANISVTVAELRAGTEL